FRLHRQPPAVNFYCNRGGLRRPYAQEAHACTSRKESAVVLLLVIWRIGQLAPRRPFGAKSAALTAAACCPWGSPFDLAQGSAHRSATQRPRLTARVDETVTRAAAPLPW